MKVVATTLRALACTGAAVLVALAPNPTGAGAAPADEDTRLDVALKWTDQAQFAGFYVADRQGFFAERGIAVTTSPGGPGVNPVDEVAAGRADVAVASMAQAVVTSSGGRRFVNVAQIFDTSPSMLLCRLGTDRLTDADLRTATIAAADRSIIDAMLTSMFPTGHEATFVPLPSGIDVLVDGRADCLWGFTFNEYWQAIDAGIEVFQVSPSAYGIPNLEDGLYVAEDRLSDPRFRSSLVQLLLGLEEGWQFAAAHEAATVQIILDVDANLDQEDQRRQLESVLPLLGDRFGYLDVGLHERTSRLGVPVLPSQLEDRLWTHSVFNEAGRAEGTVGLLTPVTRHYVGVLQATVWFEILVAVGIAGAAFSGVMVGLALEYRFWGRLVLGVLTALGGGFLRDVLLGDDRYPTYLLDDPTHLYVVVGVAAGVTIVRYSAPGLLSGLRALSQPANTVGFAILSANGAMVAIVAGTTAIWVPVAAALSIAGGGVLVDVLVRREHQPFRGEVYEEMAVIGALFLLAGLWLANRYEHRPIMILLAVVTTLALLAGARTRMYRLGISYPVGGRRAGHISDIVASRDEPIDPHPDAHSGPATPPTPVTTGPPAHTETPP